MDRRNFLKTATFGATGLLGKSSEISQREVEWLQETGKDSWPSFQYDKQNTGWNPDGKGPKKDAGIDWCVDIGAETDEVNLAPVVKNGNVHVRGEKKIYSVDTSKGKIKDTNEAKVSLSELVEETEKKSVSQLPVQSVGNDQVLNYIFLSGAKEKRNGETVVYTNKFYVDRWKKYEWGFSTSDIPFSPTVTEEMIYLADGKRRLFGVKRKEDGLNLQVIRSDLTVNSWASPAITQNYIFLPSDEELYALDSENHKTEWSYKTDDTIHSAPVVVDGVVYFGSDDGKVYALDKKTGNKLWDFDIGNKIRSSPAVANGNLYIRSGSILYKLRKDGSKSNIHINITEWNRRLDGSMEIILRVGNCSTDEQNLTVYEKEGEGGFGKLTSMSIAPGNNKKTKIFVNRGRGKVNIQFQIRSNNGTVYDEVNTTVEKEIRTDDPPDKSEENTGQGSFLGAIVASLLGILVGRKIHKSRKSDD